MLTFHPVEIARDLGREDLLFVGNFFPLKGMWWRKRKQRQGLILSIAVAWYRSMKQNPSAPGFINEEVLITSLTRQVHDARVILERFFEITRIGFNFGEGNKSPTLISPLRLNGAMIFAVEQIINEVRFVPGAAPAGQNLVQSTVTVRKHRKSFITTELQKSNREDLIPACNWLFEQDNPILFYYEKSGFLQARDKSVWPIKSIELWPGWLRTELFGTVIDLENAYCQFILKQLERKFIKNPERLNLKYPDLLRMDRDKTNFREDICINFLKLPANGDNISVVKKLMMALANGSNASPALLTSSASRSEAVNLVKAAAPDLLPSEIIKLGNKLSSIAKQFSAAKRDLCIFLLNLKPTRENQKKIFSLYFAWERESRYAIWNAVGQTGLHLHDGCDGIQTQLTNAELIQYIAQKTSLRVSVESPTEEFAQ